MVTIGGEGVHIDTAGEYFLVPADSLNSHLGLMEKMDEQASKIGGLVFRHRKNLKLKQANVAKIAKIAVRTLRDIESGKRKAQADTLRSLIEALGSGFERDLVALGVSVPPPMPPTVPP